MKITIESDYIKAGVNVKEGDILTLLDEGKYKSINTKEGPKKVLQFSVELSNGETKIYTMNTTTQKNLIEEWGDDSNDWQGKELRAWIVRQLSFGKMISVLILSPKSWTAPNKEESDEIPIVEDEPLAPERYMPQGDESYENPMPDNN